MPIAETVCSPHESKSSSTPTWCGWKEEISKSSKSQVPDCKYHDNRHKEQPCCCMCHDRCQKPCEKASGSHTFSSSLNHSYAYDPGIEEFILDDNELNNSRFYTDPSEFYNWNINSQINSKSPLKKSVKSVSIIDTLSELVSGTPDHNLGAQVKKEPSTHRSPGILKVRDVKNRSRRKHKQQQFLHKKGLSSSLPHLNISNPADATGPNEIEREDTMSCKNEDASRRRHSNDFHAKVSASVSDVDSPYADQNVRAYQSNAKREDPQCSPSKTKKKDYQKSRRSKLTRRLSSFERAHTPDWIAKIFEVAKKGRLQELKHLLDGMDSDLIMNLSDRHGNSLLHISCYYNHLSCLKWLLSFNPESQHSLMDENKSGLTPIVVATKRGWQQSVEWLLANTISENQLYYEDGRRSLLHYAAKYGQVKVVECITYLMMKNCQNINIADQNGCTPLHLAARYGKNSTVKFLVMHGADLEEKDCRGFRAYDHAIQHGQIDCSEYILSLESSMAIASDSISLENEFKSLKIENSAMKSCCKEALSLSKKLIKEREQIRQQFRMIHGGFYHLNELLSRDSNEMKEGNKNTSETFSGIQIDELKKLVASVNASLQSNQLNASSDDNAQKIQNIEDKWRNIRLKTHSRVYNGVTKPIDVIKHHQTQVKLKSAPDKSNEIELVYSSSESALSSPESDHSDCSISEFEQKNVNRRSNDSIPNIIKPTSKINSNRTQIKDYRKMSSKALPSSLTAELAAAVRQSKLATGKPIYNDRTLYDGSPANRTPKELNCHNKSRHQITSLQKDHNIFHDEQNFLIHEEGQTCSVLEVLDPSSDDEQQENKSFLVKKDDTVMSQGKVSGKITKDTSQNVSSSNQRLHKIHPSRNRKSLTVSSKYSQRPLKNDSKISNDTKKQKDYSIPYLDNENSRNYYHMESDQQRRRRSPRLMPNRCAKSDIEDLDGPDFDDISYSNLIESFRFSEPDLIKGTKAAKINEHNSQLQSHHVNRTASLESLDEINEEPLSNADRLSASASVSSSMNAEVQFPSVSSTSESSVNSVGAILDSSIVYPPNTSTPIKKKGLLLKLQTLKKRWPSRHKFTPNKKSHEITPENFKETYLRSPGESKEYSANTENSNTNTEDRGKSDKLSTVPRQRESVCSASSTSSRQEFNNPKLYRKESSDQLKIPEDENVKSKNQIHKEKKDPPTPATMCKRPPLPDVPPLSEVPIHIPPPLFPGTRGSCNETVHLIHNRGMDSKKELSTPSEVSVPSLTNNEQDLARSLSSSTSKSDSLSRPASSASRSNFSPHIVTATAETVKAASAVAGFPLHKSSSISTDLLSPDSSTAGRMSPAPSEISKTESALSPPSDVSKTESTRHLNQLEKIDETKQGIAAMKQKSETNNTILANKESLLLVKSFEKAKVQGQVKCSQNDQQLQNSLIKNDLIETSKRVTIQKSQKPWYEVSDEEDMPSPSRYEMVASAARCSSSEDERVGLCNST
ncbi:Synphilin-1 [Nymphon striatum]|nr:Synphilin-1 [Nymphon striatum]